MIDYQTSTVKMIRIILNCLVFAVIIAPSQQYGFHLRAPPSARPPTEPPPTTTTTTTVTPTTATTTTRPTTTTTPLSCGSDVLFVLDSTSSVASDFKKQKAFVKEIVSGFEISPSDYMVGVVLYSSEKRQKIMIPIDQFTSKQSLLNAIDDLPFLRGITATGAAIKLAAMALQDGRRTNQPAHVIVVTDGYSFDQVKAPADNLRRMGRVKVFAAGVATKINRQGLLEIVAGRPEDIFLGDNTDALRKTICHLATTTTSVSTTTTSPTTSSMSTRITSPTTTTTKKSKLKCGSDVLFVLDSTSSVKEDFKKQKEYVKQIVSGLKISNADFMVGLVLFSSPRRQMIKIRLGEHTDKMELLTAIDKLPFLRGITAIGAALELAKTALKYGRRAQKEAKVVVITDGYSYDMVQEPANELRSLRSTQVLAAGVASRVSRSELLNIVGGEESNLYLGKASTRSLIEALC